MCGQDECEGRPCQYEEHEGRCALLLNKEVCGRGKKEQYHWNTETEGHGASPTANPGAAFMTVQVGNDELVEVGNELSALQCLFDKFIQVVFSHLVHE